MGALNQQSNRERIDINFLDDDIDDSEETNDKEEVATTTTPRRRRQARPVAPKSLAMETSPKTPFTEDDVTSAMRQRDLQQRLGQYDWESGEYYAEIKRLYPPVWRNRNCMGYIASFNHFVDEAFLQNNFGGGQYEIVVRGPSNTGKGNKSFLTSARAKIAGDPIIEGPQENSFGQDGGFYLASPQPAPVNKTQMDEARMRNALNYVSPGAANAQPGNGAASQGSDSSMVRMSFDTMTNQLKQASEEAKELRTQLLAQATRKTTESDPAISMLRESTKELVDSERRNRERDQGNFERYLAVAGSQRHGIPPEMLQTLTEQHRSELHALTESSKTQIALERERYDREMAAVRERYDREIDVLRTQMTARIEQEQDYARREMEKTRQSAEDQMKQEKRDFERRMESERLFAGKDRESLVAQYRQDRELLQTQHQMQVENLRAIQEYQMSQGSTEHKALMEMQQTSYEARIHAMEQDLERLRRELDETKIKVSDQGDLAMQAKRISEVTKSLRDVFDPHASMTALSRTIEEPEERYTPEEPPKGVWGHLMSLANTDFGKELVGTIVRAASGNPPAAMYQYQGLPQANQGMQMNQPQYYSPAAPTAPPYGAQPYTQPPPYEYGHGMQLDDEDIEEEYEDEEGAGGEYEEEAGSAERGEYKPQETKQAAPGGVVVSAQMASKENGEAKKAKEIGIAETLTIDKIPEEALQQIKMLITGIEEAMNNNVPAHELAQNMLAITTPEQMRPYADTPLESLLELFAQISPETMLTSFAGKQYLRTLQLVLHQATQLTAPTPNQQPQSAG